MSEDRELEDIKRKMLSRIISKQKQSTILQPGIVTVITEMNFDQAISTSSPLLADFWADWCMPCKMMAPIIESLAKDYKDRVYFAKINVDENQSIALRYGVRSIPNFILFKNGKVMDQLIGAIGRQRIEASIVKHLG